MLAALLLGGCAAPPIMQGIEFREVSDARFDSFVAEMETRAHFTGVVLVMRDGRVLHAKGYGKANAARSNDADTKMHVGSITKQFTAAAILQLVGKGTVRLDTPINDYLPPEYRSSKWEAVTLHHLLSHTSGIPDYAVTRDYYVITDGFCSDDTVDGMVKEAGRQDLEFAPGSRYAYTNLGYTLLGIVIENRTTLPYGEYIQRHVLDPMGMTSSRIHVAGHVPAADEADGFRWNEEHARHVPDDVERLPVTAPDGGLITTLGDFAKWGRLFTGGQSILEQRSIEAMSSPHIRIGNGGPLDSMGYGLFTGDRLLGHGGLITGFSSQFVFDRETRSLIAVFSNDAGGDPQQVTFGLLTRLLTPE